MTSQVLCALEEKGLTVRTTVPVDTRAKRLQVTPAGAALAPRAIEAVDQAFFQGLNAQTLDFPRQLSTPG